MDNWSFATAYLTFRQEGIANSGHTVFIGAKSAPLRVDISPDNGRSDVPLPAPLGLLLIGFGAMCPQREKLRSP